MEDLDNVEKEINTYIPEWRNGTSKSMDTGVETMKEKFPTVYKAMFPDRNKAWLIKQFKRDSEEYFELLKRVFEAKYINDKDFRNALRASKKYELTHSTGKSNPDETILIEKEFLELYDQILFHTEESLNYCRYIRHIENGGESGGKQ